MASVCGRRAEVERRRNGALSGAEPERNGTAEPQTEANAYAMKTKKVPLVTSAGFAERNKRGRGGRQGRDRQRVERSKARVGHGESVTTEFNS
jgi:hypothetical protein